MSCGSANETLIPYFWARPVTRSTKPADATSRS